MQATLIPVKNQRIMALDFTKGALVLFMVLYHWLNYFIGTEGQYYRYLRFLTPSFIFITGFMISHIYLSKYTSTDVRLSKRLFVRALKLIAIFVVLNVARIFIAPALSGANLTKSQFSPGDIVTIFVSGNISSSGGKLLSFYILLPISYLLMLSAVLILPLRVNRYTFHFVCALMLLLSLILGWTGMKSQNLELVTIGMLGVVVGFRPIEEINKLIRYPFTLCIVYLLYLGAITVLDVPYPLEVAGTILSVTIIYLVGTSKLTSGGAQRVIVLLGKYSLFGYISQIAILQGLEACMRRLGSGSFELVVSFVAAFALTILIVEAVDRARSARKGIDWLYKLAFN
jgi:peptidoglycan/LPS O-acetylase OafA/YrhL